MSRVTEANKYISSPRRIELAGFFSEASPATRMLFILGRRVLAYANDIFSKGEELESLMLKGLEPEHQSLSIGVLSTMLRNFVDGFIAPLLSREKTRFSLHARGFSNL